MSDNHVIKNNVITNVTFDDANTGGGWGILRGGTGFTGADNNTFTDNESVFISGNFLHDMGFGAFGDGLGSRADARNQSRRGEGVACVTNSGLGRRAEFQ